MKNQILAVTLVISCICNLSIDTETNQNAVAQTASQIRLLRDCGIPTVLPSYIPPGFKLTNFQVEACKPRLAHYDATYKGSNNCSFNVSGANGGWGANGPVRQWDVITPLFGKILLEEYDGSERIPPVPYLTAGVIPDSESGRGVIPGFPKAGYIFSFSCKYGVFSPQQASQILKSVRIVK